MSIASLDQVKGMLRGLFGVADRRIIKAQETADAAHASAARAEEVAAAAQESSASKMEADNPVATGSFSMGRALDSKVGTLSHAAGFSVTASGSYSSAVGNMTTASGMHSRAEGQKAVASGNASHAEGSATTASGAGSHAEGGSTAASGSYAHAEGSGTTASAQCSHAEGLGTTAAGDVQHVQGKNNIVDSQHKYAHIVGNGASADARSNAHTLDWSGNAWYAGTVEGTAVILTSPNGTRYQITVDDTGTLTATAL